MQMSHTALRREFQTTPLRVKAVCEAPFGAAWCHQHLQTATTTTATTAATTTTTTTTAIITTTVKQHHRALDTLEDGCLSGRTTTQVAAQLLNTDPLGVAKSNGRFRQKPQEDKPYSLFVALKL
jgi:hypothetical protein